MKQTFITSYLTFYLKASVALEGDFIKTSNPNTILKVIPLGAQNKTIPVDHISSVDDSFRLDFKSFAWGIIFALVGFNMMGSSYFRRINPSCLWHFDSIKCIPDSFDFESNFWRCTCIECCCF